MPERVKLKYFSAGVLSIRWAAERPDYEKGDCYVLACREATDTEKLDPHAGPAPGWSQPMTEEEAYAFIASRPKMLGSQIRDCRGLALLDGQQGVIDFEPPIQVRNHR